MDITKEEIMAEIKSAVSENMKGAVDTLRAETKVSVAKPEKKAFNWTGIVKALHKKDDLSVFNGVVDGNPSDGSAAIDITTADTFQPTYQSPITQRLFQCQCPNGVLKLVNVFGQSIMQKMSAQGAQLTDKAMTFGVSSQNLDTYASEIVVPVQFQTSYPEIANQIYDGYKTDVQVALEGDTLTSITGSSALVQVERDDNTKYTRLDFLKGSKGRLCPYALNPNTTVVIYPQGKTDEVFEDRPALYGVELGVTQIVGLTAIPSLWVTNPIIVDLSKWALGMKGTELNTMFVPLLYAKWLSGSFTAWIEAKIAPRFNNTITVNGVVTGYAVEIVDAGTLGSGS